MSEKSIKIPNTRLEESLVKKSELTGITALLALVLLISAPSARSQNALSSSLNSDNSTLPDAPARATTCTERNGKPCAEWVHKLIGQYPPLPDSIKIPAERDPSSVHFWTFRGAEHPPLRNNKQVFHSKLFLAAHVGGAIAMVVACRTKNSGEEWASEAPAVAAMFGMDYLQFRFIGGPNAVAAPVYEMIHYSRASTK